MVQVEISFTQVTEEGGDGNDPCPLASLMVQTLFVICGIWKEEGGQNRKKRRNTARAAMFLHNNMIKHGLGQDKLQKIDWK